MDEEGNAIVTAAELDAIRAGFDDSLLVYNVTTLPTDGYITLASLQLDVGDTFTQEDVENSLLEYVHTRDLDDSLNASDITDSFTLTLFDTHFYQVVVFTIGVTNINEAPPPSPPPSPPPNPPPLPPPPPPPPSPPPSPPPPSSEFGLFIQQILTGSPGTYTYSLPTDSITTFPVAITIPHGYTVVLTSDSDTDRATMEGIQGYDGPLFNVQSGGSLVIQDVSFTEAPSIVYAASDSVVTITSCIFDETVESAIAIDFVAYDTTPIAVDVSQNFYGSSSGPVIIPIRPFGGGTVINASETDGVQYLPFYRDPEGTILSTGYIVSPADNSATKYQDVISYDTTFAPDTAAFVTYTYVDAQGNNLCTEGRVTQSLQENVTEYHVPVSGCATSDGTYTVQIRLETISGHVIEGSETSITTSVTNHPPPATVVSKIITIQVTSSTETIQAPLTTEYLDTSLASQTNERLKYTIAGGTGPVVMKVGGTAVGIGSTFTDADVEAGIVTLEYTHNSPFTYPSVFSFDLTISDGLHVQEVSLHVALINRFEDVGVTPEFAVQIDDNQFDGGIAIQIL